MQLAREKSEQLERDQRVGVMVLYSVTKHAGKISGPHYNSESETIEGKTKKARQKSFTSYLPTSTTSTSTAVVTAVC